MYVIHKFILYFLISIRSVFLGQEIVRLAEEAKSVPSGGTL
jgi:hypothetical protein